MLGKSQFEELCQPLGRELIQRTTLYKTHRGPEGQRKHIPVAAE
ncbi:MAG: hypothetical protein CM15mP49_04230 [Actinomycetota bacterium]|nr:MAG: hypothetical protein CM15mP49_04230 [Actinomycetota bacterium]